MAQLHGLGLTNAAIYRRLNRSTQAAVLRPTPGSEHKYVCASGTESEASQSSASSPRGAVWVTVHNVANRAAPFGFGDLPTVEVDFSPHGAAAGRFGDLCTWMDRHARTAISSQPPFANHARTRLPAPGTHSPPLVVLR